MYKIAKFAGIKNINTVLTFCSNVKGSLRGAIKTDDFCFKQK